MNLESAYENENNIFFFCNTLLHVAQPYIVHAEVGRVMTKVSIII